MKSYGFIFYVNSVGQPMNIATKMINSFKMEEYFIPVIIHNLHGYHSHLIMKLYGKVDKEITCLPNRRSTYRSLLETIYRLIAIFECLAG